MASAGHSHTALLTITGKVLTFGCAHFGKWLEFNCSGVHCEFSLM